ncbi:MAG: RNA-guided pseudouridylation complex pseudouridine synthase subunit Cbf5 [Candidatus Woesearchaeota archaeon]|nr:RNA-guided pseudouridylation complex pseudouridine synthase subunit Cbf5 [Candidatus Woesearchaeota archaeon]
MGQLPFEKRTTNTLTRSDATTDKQFGSDPSKRTIPELLERGIVVIDKPAGPTSHQVSAYVQKILGITKSGHSGTLDPGVTGVLPCALGKGTRIVQSLLNAGKEYICLMHLHQDVSEKQLAKVFKQFTGKIRQLPPIISAVKRQWRYRKIYYLEIIERHGREVLFRVGCQAGTYIRKLVSDMGDALGCGAHMVELRRSKAASFHEEESVTLQDLTDAFYYYEQGDETHLQKILLPLERGVQHLHKVWVFDTAVNTLCNGMQLKVPGIVKVSDELQVDDPVAVMTLKDELILVGRAQMTSRQMLGEQGIAVKTEQVFMPTDVYPRSA